MAAVQIFNNPHFQIGDIHRPDEHRLWTYLLHGYYRKDGFKRFNIHEHTEFWKAEDAKRDGKGFSELVEDC